MRLRFSQFHLDLIRWIVSKTPNSDFPQYTKYTTTPERRMSRRRKIASLYFFVLSRGENENKILVLFITLQTWTGTRKREMGDERWNGYLDSRISGIWLKFRSSMISRNWSIQSWKLNKIRPWLRVVRSTWKKRVVKSEFIENRNRHFVGKLKDLDRGLERSLYYTFTQGRWRNIEFWDEQGNKME